MVVGRTCLRTLISHRHRVLQALGAQGTGMQSRKAALFHHAHGQRPGRQAVRLRVQQQQLQWPHVLHELRQLRRQLTVRQQHRVVVIVHTPSRYNAKQHGGHGGQRALLEGMVRQVDR